MIERVQNFMRAFDILKEMIQGCVSRSYRNDTKGYGKTSCNFSLLFYFAQFVYLFLLVFRAICQPFDGRKVYTQRDFG